MNKPFFNKQKKAWYVWTVDGDGKRRPIRLAKTRRESFEEWHRLVESAKRDQAGNPLYADLASEYVEFAQWQIENGQLQQETLENYAWFLDSFCEECGHIPVMDLAPKHVTDWLIGKSWGQSTQHKAITSVKRVLGWAAKEKRIPNNPLTGIERPRTKRRTTLIDKDSHRRMVLHAGSQPFSSIVDRQIRLVLIALRHTGGRPQDIANARVEGVDPACLFWVLDHHKREHQTEKPKIVYLSPCMRTITRMLAGDRTSGPLFRGRRGSLTVNAIRCRIRILRQQLDDLPAGTVAYAYRHTYITEALENDKSVATVAELVGTSASMIEKVYGHLGSKQSHLIHAASTALVSPRGE